MKSFILGGAFLCASLTHANCGLDYCPRLSLHERPASNSVSVLIKNVAFNLDSGSGSYEELLARYEYTGVHSWVFGASLPVTALTVHAKTPPVGSKTDYGFSNPLLYASWYGHINATGMIYAGLQLELPFGNFEAGMAGDHFMVVPYVLVEQSFGAGYVLGGLGYSHAYAVGDAEEHPLYVNPHEDQEVQYRAGAGFRFWDDKLTPQISVNGKHAIVDELEGPGRDHIAGSIAVTCNMGNGFTLSPSVEWPLNSPKRFDWSAGLEIKSLF